MSSAQAMKILPSLIIIPPNFELYKSVSKQVFEIFQRYTDKIESLSLDEAYLDVTESDKFDGSATLIAKDIRKKIFEEWLWDTVETGYEFLETEEDVKEWERMDD